MMVDGRNMLDSSRDRGVVRILHLADVHLDTAFAARDELLRQRLREATRQALEAAVEAALQRSADAVLIAGDLFDSQRLSLTTERFLARVLKRLEAAGIPVFYATGNHDPGQGPILRDKMAWPGNVTVFADPQPRTVPLNNPQGRQIAWITGAGHLQEHEERNLARTFPRPRTDLPHLAVLHSQVSSSAGHAEHERYAPCSELDLQRSGYAYWALGHVHQRQRISERVPAWYPGNIQGRHPGEHGLKGCLWAEIGPHGPERLEFIPLGPLVWHWLEMSCPQNVVSLDRMVAALAEEVRSRVSLDGGRDHLIRLDLKGQSPRGADLGHKDTLDELTEVLQAELGVHWLEVRSRGLVQPVDLEAFQGSATTLGEALTIVEELRQDPDRIESFPDLTLAGPDRAEDRAAYVREVLQGMEEELAAWVVSRTKA